MTADMNRRVCACLSFTLLLISVLLCGCGSAEQEPQASAGSALYLDDQGGEVTLNLLALLPDGGEVTLKHKDFEQTCTGDAARRILRCIDEARYTGKPKPSPTDAKGYLWAAKGAVGEDALFYFFLEDEDSASLVVINDNREIYLSLEPGQGGLLAGKLEECIAQEAQPTTSK